MANAKHVGIEDIEKSKVNPYYRLKENLKFKSDYHKLRLIFK